MMNFKTGLLSLLVFCGACSQVSQKEDIVKDSFDFAGQQLKFAFTTIDSVRVKQIEAGSKKKLVSPRTIDDDGSFKMNNTTWALDTTNLDSKVGETYNYKRWSSFNSAAGSEIEQDWRDHNNCELFDDYFKNVNLHIAPGTMYSAGVRSDELQLVWTQVTTCIKEGSWKAIYASSDEEFDKIVADMVAQANEYGYDQCVEFQQNEVTLRAAAEDAATEEAAVEVLEEPPQAVIAAVAPTTADAFRKSRREIIFIIMFSFNSYLSIFTGAILHAPVIPARIIPLQHPTVQENKFTRLKEFFCAISTNGL